MMTECQPITGADPMIAMGDAHVNIVIQGGMLGYVSHDAVAAQV
jgi:hypothetical protein